ncbi:MAG: sulfatase [Prolixibacteraceae bacterium]|nr:sulfatase [Prolixibacteraceae bacterium]
MIKTVVFSIMIFLGIHLKAQESPNILWLTSEDNNVDWIGCYGNLYAETPNIDQLASEGFRYTHVYASAPVCAPSRSTWITGINAVSMGTHPMRSRYDIPHDVIKYYPDLLKEAGYYVANDKKTDYNIGGREDSDCWDSMDTDWNTLKNKQPFFQVINYNESHESRAQGGVENTNHNPEEVKLKAYHPDLPEIRKNYAKYHDAVKRMDADIGKTLEMLEEKGLADNTIVIYNSDHGGVLPRSKRFIFASGIHSPLVIRIPEKYKKIWPSGTPGETVDQLVSFLDMPKTWLSICNAEVPEYMQGRTFLGGNTEKEAEYHFAFRGRMDEGCENARAVYTKDMVYIRNYMPYVPWMQRLEYLWKMKATKAWSKFVDDGFGDDEERRFFYAKNFSEELYDLNDDPDNVNNLIDDPAYKKQIKNMRKALRKWQLDIHDAALLPETESYRLAKENGVTIYEMVRNENMYNLPALLDAADLAMEQDKNNIRKLRANLESDNLGVRYWAIVGLFLINDVESGLKAINDESDEVRIMAAWLLVKNGEVDKGISCIKDLLKSESYAMLKILNVINWMDNEYIAQLAPYIREAEGMNTPTNKYVNRITKYLLNK